MTLDKFISFNLCFYEHKTDEKDHLATWRWIQNYKNWNLDDWERYDNDGVYNDFKKRPGATCGYGDDRLYHFDFCVCDDNIQA